MSIVRGRKSDARLICFLSAGFDRQAGEERTRPGSPTESRCGYLNGGTLIAEHVEVESGKLDTRPELAKALARCKLTGAILIVAKLDRLSRNQSFLMSVYEGTGEGGVVFCDLPTIPAGPVGKFIVQQMAAVAELERGLISQRTKAALAAAKERGKALGGYRGGPVVDHTKGTAAVRKIAAEFAASVGPMALEMHEAGRSLHQIAATLTVEGIKTPRGGKWTPTAVRNLLNRAA